MTDKTQKTKQDGRKTSWTPERRAAASARCRAYKPWQQSTGPVTLNGKIRSSLNAVKHGKYSVNFVHAYQMLKLNREFMKNFRAFNQVDFTRMLYHDDILREKELIKLKQEKWGKILKNNSFDETMGRGDPQNTGAN